jgi:hypothetical protein
MKLQQNSFAVIEHAPEGRRIIVSLETKEACVLEAQRLNRVGDYFYEAVEVNYVIEGRLVQSLVPRYYGRLINW